MDSVCLSPRTELLAGKRILVVDDVADSRDLLAHVLKHCGAIVEEADCAEAALHALEETPVDLLISDIAMSHQDGYSLVCEVRRQYDHSRLPAVAVTAFSATSAHRNQAFDAGFDLFITKPFDPAELIAMIAPLLSRQPTG